MTVTEPRVQDSVGAALYFARSNWQSIAGLSVAGALANTLIQMLGSLAPGMPLVTVFFVLALYALVYATFIGLALRGGRPQVDWKATLRLLGAMSVVGFFLLIVGFVLFMVGGVIVLGGPYASFVQEMSRASGDQNAVNALALRMFASNPWPVIGLAAVYFAVWLYLTTRLYLAAPASVDRGRILTFETWAWTKKTALKVAGARAMLIGPAFVLSFALTYLLGRAAGIDLFNAQTAAPQPVGALVFALGSGFISYCISDALGAGLSTALYRDLGGQSASLPPR
ncbi:MAG: hypothetical protein QM759_01510 [Terricaulis sp.]